MMLSVIVPCFNEAVVLDVTYRRLVGVLEKLADVEFELILVDDGSRDDTSAIIERLAAVDSRVISVLLSRNFGHQFAVTAGIDFADGDAVVIIDADLQDPPELIPTLVERWREGFHVVYAQRGFREGETPFKLLTARIFYRLMARLSETPIPLDTGDYRLMDRQVVELLRQMPERHRFIRGMVSWVGFRQIAVVYNREARYAGETKYPLTRMIRFAMDGLTSFSTAPLRIATFLGFAAAGVALLGVFYALASRLLTDSWVPGWAALMVAVTFFGGVQLASLGVLGEYVGRLYEEAKGRPLYIVAKSNRTRQKIV